MSKIYVLAQAGEYLGDLEPTKGYGVLDSVTEAAKKLLPEMDKGDGQYVITIELEPLATTHYREDR